MKTAIILHGMPSKMGYYNPEIDCQSNEHWLPWIQARLVKKDILAQTPELPRPYEPVFKDWLGVFNQFNVDEDTVLIGHSCGAGFLVRWLDENEVKVKKVVLVAPWVDPDKEKGKYNVEMFKNYKVGKSLNKKVLDGITVFSSDNDSADILESVSQITGANPEVKLVNFHNYGHFCFRDMKTREFPELLTEILR